MTACQHGTHFTCVVRGFAGWAREKVGTFKLSWTSRQYLGCVFLGIPFKKKNGTEEKWRYTRTGGNFQNDKPGQAGISWWRKENVCCCCSCFALKRGVFFFGLRAALFNTENSNGGCPLRSAGQELMRKWRQSWMKAPPSRYLRRFLRVPAAEHCGRSPDAAPVSYLLITLYWRPAGGKGIEGSSGLFLFLVLWWFEGPL